MLNNRRTPFINVTAKPLSKLPANAYRARRVAHVETMRKPLASPDYGIFIQDGLPAGWSPTLMTWGCNFDRAQVDRSPGRKFVFVGLVGNGKGDLRENFEEVL